MAYGSQTAVVCYTDRMADSALVRIRVNIVGRHKMTTVPVIHLKSNARSMWDAHHVMAQTSSATAIAQLGEIAEAYTLAIEVVATLANRFAATFAKSNVMSSKVEAILAGYIVGVTLVEHAILSGYSAQAAALVRQELEAIAALEELRKGSRKDGKTPNVRHVPTVPGHVYSDLSKLTHFSDTEALRVVALLKDNSPAAPGPAEVWLLSPQHVLNTTRQLFALHTLLLLHFAEYQALHYVELHGNHPDENEVAAVDQALNLLRTAGVLG